MSTYYSLIKKIPGCDVFDGRFLTLASQLNETGQ